MAANAPLLRLDGVRFRYRGGWRLGPIEAEVGPGVTALVGPNGAGKSTLIRILAGAAVPAEGALVREGEIVGRGRGLDRYRQHVGYLPQEAHWASGWRVRDYLDYVAQAYRVPRRKVAGRRDAVLEETRATEFAGRRLGSLSGGQRQRVHLASAVVHDPAVVILDEPTVGLDPAERVRIRKFIRREGERRAVVVSTHLMDDVAMAARDVWVMSDGTVRWRGGVDALAALAPEGTRGVSRAEAGYLTMFES